MVLLAKSSTQCQNAGKKLKTIQKQTEYGKNPAAENHNDEIAIYLAGPFKFAPDNKKYLLVSIDHTTNWPDAQFMRRPTTDKGTDFLNKYIAEFGIPKRIRTDAATIFRIKNLNNIKCPVHDHRGNGKIERLIRTLNERLSADKTIFPNKGTTGLSSLLFALRTAATANGNSPFERVFERKPNTVKSILTEKPNKCLQNDKQLQLSHEEFPKDNDSTIFLRDRTKNTKLESQFKKKRGAIAAESSHTFTIETPRGRQIYSKRDVAESTTKKKKNNQPETKTTKRQILSGKKISSPQRSRKSKTRRKQTPKTLRRESP